MSRRTTPNPVFIAVGPGLAGSKHHRLASCASKGDQSVAIRMSRSGAEQLGYDPCGKCHR